MSELAGYYEGARIEVEWRDGHQVVRIFVPSAMRGGLTWGLVDVLCERNKMDLVCDGDLVVEFVHDEAVDRRIVELIDLLAHIRSLHPRFIQLPLALSEEERARIEEALVR